MAVLTVAMYRLKILASHWPTMLLMLLVPLAGSVLTSAITMGVGQSIPVALVDEDRSEYSRTVVQRLMANPVMQVAVTDRSSAVLDVRRQRVEAALIIKAGFQEQIIKNELDGLIDLVKSRASLSAELTGEYLASEAIRLASNALAANEVTADYEQGHPLTAEQRAALWAKAWSYSDSHWEPEPLMRMEYQEAPARATDLTHPEQPRQASSQLTVTLFASLLLFNVLLSAGWLVQDREQGLLHRIRTTRGGLLPYLAGSWLAVFLVGLATALLAGAGLWWYGKVSLSLGLPGALLLLAYLVAISGLSHLAGGTFRTQRQLQAALPFITVLSGLLAAGTHVLGEISSRFAAMAWLTPQGWLAAALGNLALGGNAGSIAVPVLVLTATGCLSFVATWRGFLR